MPGRLLAFVSLLAVASLASACPTPGQKGRSDAGASGGARELTLFFTVELQGEIEPCGCTSDPLGDLARLAALVDEARKQRGGAVAWFDGGSTLYKDLHLAGAQAGQERLKAGLLAEQLPKMGLTATGLGPYDLADGKDKVLLPRQAANVADGGGVALDKPRVVDVGGAKIGVFGVTNPAAVAGAGVQATDPVEAARTTAKALRAQGAQVIVALVQMDRREAKQLAREVPGLDFIVAGENAPEEPATAPNIPGLEVANDSSYVIAPYERGQSIVRVDLTLAPGGGPIVDAIGEARAKDRIAQLDESITDLEGKLTRFKADPSADPKFLASLQQQIDEAKAKKADLEKNPLRKPASGSWMTATHVLVKKGLRCDPAVVAAKQGFFAAAGAKNLEAAKGQTPAPVPAGGAGYVGTEECEFCHKSQVDFWRKTKHASAFATIEKAQKTWDPYCVSCHVTGWNEPGGSILTGPETLHDVQCETCHGPGSAHVDANGKALESLVKRPDEKRCVHCHEPAHSDTFDYTAYLRDVTGPGHGEKFRKSLGEGATGRQLRQAALDKAGQSIGEGCPK